MRIFPVILFACVLTFSSCQFLGGEWVSGNGHIVSQQMNPGAFSSVEVSGDIKVHIQQNATPGVKIETDENLLQYLDVYASGNTLVIRSKKGYNLHPSKEVIAYVSAPSFKNIGVSGSCDIIGDSPITGSENLEMHVSGSGDITMQVALPKVTTEISGSGSVSLKGQATDFEARVSGSGDVKCFDLVTDNTNLHISGSSDAEVNAEKQLNVEVSGAGNVSYKGNASVTQHISGSGSIKKVG